MRIHVMAGALSFCIFSLGLFLGGAVRPLLMTAMKSEPALIGPILTRMFSRYNVVALGLSVLVLILEMMATPSLATLLLTVALTLILALKLPFDKVIERREKAAQIRGIGEEGKRLDRLHKVVEKATLAIIALSFASFVLNLLPGGQL
jgi:hypothetical protein